MLGRQQLYLELNDETDESDDMTEIMSNAHLNQHFLALGREVRIVSNMVRLVLKGLYVEVWCFTFIQRSYFYFTGLIFYCVFVISLEKKYNLKKYTTSSQKY